MTCLENLEQLANGNRPIESGLLGTAKLSWSQLDCLSGEDVLAAFGSHPFALDGKDLRLQTEQHAAIIGAEAALIADLYEGRIGRLWRIGDEIAQPDQHVLNVAFDADMEQDRSKAIHFRAEDHSDLPPNAAEKLLIACASLIDQRRRTGKLRVRGFVVRAFGNDQGSVALLSLFSLGDLENRSASFDYAVVACAPNRDSRFIESKQNTRNWTPRL